jgi:hypothetical protein
LRWQSQKPAGSTGIINEKKKTNALAVYSITARENNSRRLKRHFFLNDPDDTDLEWFAIDNNLRDVNYKISSIKF